MYRTYSSLIAVLAVVALLPLTSHAGEYPNDRYKEHRTALGSCLIKHAANGTLDQLLTEAIALEVKGGTEKPEVDYVNSKYVPKAISRSSTPGVVPAPKR